MLSVSLAREEPERIAIVHGPRKRRPERSETRERRIGKGEGKEDERRSDCKEGRKKRTVENSRRRG